MTEKQVKVLYVCPYAHYPGHFPAAAFHETQALAQAGIKTMLLSFCGVIGEAEIKVPQAIVLPQIKLTQPMHCFVRLLRKWTISRWSVMFFEMFLTLSKAISIKRKTDIDIIHLRDSEPFLFLPHLQSLPYRGYRWAISLTASNIYPPTPKTFKQLVYTIVIKFLTSRIWRPLYSVSLNRNSFVFLTQNKTARQDYNSYLGGIFAGKVVYLPLGAGKQTSMVPKEKARKHLGLPLDKPVFLSFGAPHSGKDMEALFRAMSNLPDICLVHAGNQAFNLGANPASLIDEYSASNRVISRNYYIPEKEKPYYFFAADAVILSYTKQFLSTSSLLWEACCFGTPVIASDNGQLKELVKTYHTGLLFKAQDAEALKKAVGRFIKLKPAEIKKMRYNCHRFADEFSHEKWAQRCIEIYDKLLISTS